MFSAPGGPLLATATEVGACGPADEEGSHVRLDDPEPWGAEDLGPDGITVRMVVKTLPSEQSRVARYLQTRIHVALDEDGIEMPFPQHGIWHGYGHGRRQGDERLKSAIGLDADG